MNQEEEFSNNVEKRIARRGIIQKITKGVFVCAILFFIISVVYAWVSSNNHKKQIAKLDARLEVSQNDQLLDTDGDGLFDWQEELYGTSKQLRDTDGDGETDAEEVQNGRDPNYFGEGLSEESVVPQQVIFSEPELEFPEEIERGSLFTEEDFQTIKIDTSRVKEELNELGLIIQDSYGSLDASQDFNNLFLGQNYNKDNVQAVLDRNRNALERVRDYSSSELILERQSLVQAYTGIVDSLETLIDSPEEDSFIDTLSSYGNSVELLHKTIIRINAYVVSKRINFEVSEPGSFFLFVL